MKNAAISVLTALWVFPLLAHAQTSATRELRGRVVEVSNGVSKGVPNLTVSLSDKFSYDITDPNGNFKLVFPPDRDYVTVIVENAPNKMIAPPSGLVNVPPERNLQIVLCGEQNQRLMQQVNALNGKIKKLEKEKNLSQRQLLEMHRTLLDTIIYFENLIAQHEQQAKDAKESHDAEIRAKDAEIESLKDSLFVLTQRLGKALEEKFLKQKEYFDLISAELLEYADKAKDLRDIGIPPRLTYCFNRPEAGQELKQTIEAYEKIRNEILRNHGGRVLFVKQFWDNPEPAEKLKEAYRYLLETVHKEGIMPLDQQVFGQIREYAARQIGRTSAEKEAKKRSEQVVPGLTTSILELEKKTRAALDAMSNNL
jgi:hypothetical protein